MSFFGNFFSNLFGQALSDSAKQNIFIPSFHVVRQSVDMQSDWLKVIRIDIKNDGSRNANDVEADLISIKDPDGSTRKIIEAPLWWMHNQYKNGDPRVKDIPMTQSATLDVCNLINSDQGFLLYLSSEAFIGRDPKYTKLEKGKSELGIVLKEKNGHQKRLSILIDWDGSFNNPNISFNY